MKIVKEKGVRVVTTFIAYTKKGNQLLRGSTCVRAPFVVLSFCNNYVVFKTFLVSGMGCNLQLSLTQ